MSFVDLLRRSRSSPVSVLHKFMTSYDPRHERTHAFVEGAPDLAFYRNYLELYVDAGTLRMYNCEGKANVYLAYKKVVERFPDCRKTVFFVDKDLDDILGEPWPVDPRIYVTDFYAIENYVVCKEAVRRFFLDFVKIRRVEFDLEPVFQQLDSQLEAFHRALLPVMAWVVVVRRSGRRPILADVNLGGFLRFSDSGVARRGHVPILRYLGRVTQVELRAGEWRQVRRTCRELGRLESKRYIRGKFEAWFLLGFIRQLLAKLAALAIESGGSIAVNAQLSDSNFVQLLVRAVPTPQALASFLEFHLKPPEATPRPGVTRANGILGRMRRWMRRDV